MSVGNGYLSGNMLIPYPFEDGQCLSVEPERLSIVQCLQKSFVDASICFSSNMTHWPVIGAFSVSGNVLSFDISVNNIITRLSVSGDTPVKFPIIDGSAEWGTFTVVLSSEGILELCSVFASLFTSLQPVGLPLSSPFGLEGLPDFRICPKCVTLHGNGVDSIQVYDGVRPFEEGPHFIIKGDMGVRPGNNMSLAPDDFSISDITSNEENAIDISAVPGAGMGRIACSSDNSACKPHSDLAGSDGHLRLFNDTCYDWEPGEKGVVIIDGEERPSRKIIMHAKCTACCTCQMYESIVNDRLVALANTIRQAKSDILDFHQSYESAVAKFNGRISRPYLQDMSLTLTGTPVGSNISPKISNKDVSGKMSRCVFTAIVCNSSYFPVSSSIRLMTGTDSIVEASVAWSDESGSPLSVSGDSANAVMRDEYIIYPGRSMVVTFISTKKDFVSKVDTGGYTGKFSVDFKWNNVFLGSLSKTVEV